MGTLVVEPCESLTGECEPPADKSISHRSLMFGAIASTPMNITNLLRSADVLSTLQCLREIGFRIEDNGHEIRILPTPLHSLNSDVTLDCGNSGTTMRLLSGLIAPLGLNATLDGDDSLRKRPMARVANPLSQLGAEVNVQSNGCAPIQISVSNSLRYREIVLPVASAQLKSACLLTGVQSSGCTVKGGGNSRDHSERFLRAMGAEIDVSANGDVTVYPSKLKGITVDVPGDVSSAAFILSAGLMCSNSDIKIINVNVNPTRSGFIDVVKLMGADLSVSQSADDFEPVANIHVRTSRLNGVDIPVEWVPRLIDELPVIAILATQAIGTTVVKGAKELRYKESDRIKSTLQMIRAIGGEATELDDGFVVKGPQTLNGGLVNPCGDHRIAMAASVAGLKSVKGVTILDPGCIDVSFPSFSTLFSKLGAVMYNE